jgi:hypothetical protein
VTGETQRPFSDTLWDEAETWSRDRIEAFQLDALKRQLRPDGAPRLAGRDTASCAQMRRREML